MIISYPILPENADVGDFERDIAFADATYPDPPYGAGAYPLSAHLRRHGGVHISHGASPIRNIADGKVVFVRAPAKKNKDAHDPLNYGAGKRWTDNGCVVIEHQAETGVSTKIRFWSVYMHLSTVQVGTGNELKRKATIGAGGTISGEPSIHFEIFFDQAGIDGLIKRGKLPYKIFKSDDNSGDPDLWGDMHFLVPADANLFDKTPSEALKEHKTWAKAKAAHDKRERARVAAVIRNARRNHAHLDPADRRPKDFSEPEPSLEGNKVGSTEKPLWITVHFDKGTCRTTSYAEDGTLVGSAVFPGGAYEFEMPGIAKAFAPNNESAAYELLRYGRVTSEDALPTGIKNWQCVCYSASQIAYIDLSGEAVVKLSDADFPEFLGWQMVDEGLMCTEETEDGRCSAKAILDLLGENLDGKASEAEAQSRLRDPGVRKKLRRMVCQFRTEWEAGNFHDTYSFLLRDGTWGDDTPRAALTAEQYDEFKKHANALQWWADAALQLPSTLWHVHPIEFINWMRKCAWVDESTLAQIYPTTSAETRERYRLAMNQVMQKYLITNPIRQSHFFGQGAVESGSLTNMQEASMDGTHINPKSTKSEADLHHWYGEKHTEYDSYYSSEKFNSLGHRISGSYSWSNGNVGDVDAQKFRGRGFKQLTGRSNYADYWIYRGWLHQSDFNAHWWTDLAYKRRKPDEMKLKPAEIDHPDKIIEIPYNCIDSGGFYITFKRPAVKSEMDKGSGIVATSVSEIAAARKISLAVTYAINGGDIAKDLRYQHTRTALTVLN